MSDRITSWSYSRLHTYEGCPFKARLLYVEKLKEPDSPAFAKGNRIDKALEDWHNSDLALPALDIELSDDVMARMKLYKELGARPQIQWAFREDLTETDWFAKDAWCRVKLDLLYLDDVNDCADVVDYKTGKIYETGKEQLELYTLGIFWARHWVQNVHPELIYLEQNKIVEHPTKIFNREKHLDQMTARWLQRVEPMLNDTIFAPRQNKYCYRCHFRKTNGGPCKHG